VSEEECAGFVAEYRHLCAATPFVYASLFADTVAKGVLISSAFAALLGRPLVGAAVTVTGVPLLTYFVLTFCRLPPPIRPNTFARLLFLAATWVVLGTVAACVIVALASTAERPSVPTSVALALSVIGSMCGVTVLLKQYRRLRTVSKRKQKGGPRWARNPGELA
jgi:hypothetical protein